MKTSVLILILLYFTVSSASSQNLYNQANAASIENEANSVTGWTGTAAITSDISTAQNGLYSLRFAVSGTGREARYTFTAQINTIYNISIWARRTANSNNPAFANWLGLQGASTTVISNLAWTQYNFTVTATLTSPVIRVYAGPIGAASGMEVFVDAISITVSVPPDTQTPTPPTSLTATNITLQSATINWVASTDNVGVTGYIISQNSVVLATLPATSTTYNATGLTPSTTYSYTIKAFDAANNISASSDPLLVTTLSPAPDILPPSVPGNLIASGIGSSSLTLNWTASTDNVGVTNYNIWKDGVFDVSTGSANTFYTITGLTAATTYTLYVTAQDSSGNISSPSVSIQATTTDPNQGTTYTSDNANLPTVNWQALNLYTAGNAGIGTSPNSSYRLSVNGNIRAKEIIVESGWSDFVFEPGYQLPTLDSVEAYIKEHGHLKDIPSAADVKTNGIGLAQMNTLLLQKLEEMTLYVIEANKRINQLEQKAEALNPKY